jgi:hypothetical protein
MNIRFSDKVIRNGHVFTDYMAGMTHRELGEKYRCGHNEIFRRVTEHGELLQILGIPVQQNIRPRTCRRTKEISYGS